MLGTSSTSQHRCQKHPLHNARRTAAVGLSILLASGLLTGSGLSVDMANALAPETSASQNTELETTQPNDVSEPTEAQDDPASETDSSTPQEGVEDDAPVEDGEAEGPDETHPSSTPAQDAVDPETDEPADAEVPSVPAGDTSAPATSAVGPRMVATGGIGRYGDVIDWAEWGQKNRRIDNNSDVSWTKPTAAGADYWISTRCEISNVKDKTPAYPIGYPQFQGEGPGGRNPAGPANPLKSYVSGSWSGDALSNLYNVGGTGFSNTLVNAIAVDEWANNTSQRRFDATIEFQFDCGAWLINSATAPQLTSSTSTDDFTVVPLEGLVFADAESNNWYPANGTFNGSQREYISVTPNGSAAQEPSWKLLDSYKTAGCATNSVAEFLNAGDTMRFRSDGIQCATLPTFPAGGQGPASVMFLQGSTSAAVEVRGGGQGAVALGAIISLDFGDAPESYGSAAALFQPTWQGGDVSGQSTHNLSAMKNANQVTTMDTPNTILGNEIDGELEAHYSVDADWDDNNAVDDEDGVIFANTSNGKNTIVPTENSGGMTFSQSVICAGPGDVAGWIDWNRNGEFDAADKSNQIKCENGTAELIWMLPDDAVRSVEGDPDSAPTYMRVRITNQENPDGSIVDIPAKGLTTTSGEVEDYKVDVELPRYSEIIVQKMLVPSDAPEGTIEGAVPAGDDWEFGVPEDWTPEQGVSITPENVTTDENGQAAFTATYSGSTAGGNIALAEVQQPGYAVVPVESKNAVCVDVSTDRTVGVGGYEGTQSHPGFDFETTQGQSVLCTIYNKKLSYDLSWNKVAAEATDEFLAGSEWKLSPLDENGSPITAQEIAIIDCESAPCAGPDMNAASGKFQLKDIAPGEYQLEETKAPAGYELLTDPIIVTVENSHIDLGDIENEQAEVPQLPLTGGMGTLAIFLGAGGIGVLLLIALTLQRRRSRVSIG